MDERGILPSRTKIGQNVIVRVGDPTNVNDLLRYFKLHTIYILFKTFVLHLFYAYSRVGAHRASAVLVMVTDEDIIEEDASDGNVQNGCTLRVALALRHVLFTNRFNKQVPPSFPSSS